MVEFSFGKKMVLIHNTPVRHVLLKCHKINRIDLKTILNKN